ncbi:hypothetical protein BDV98DRAFT_471782, partial [Pterulicium gracile]
FQKLYDHVFPTSYLSDQQGKLEKACQGNTSVELFALHVDHLYFLTGMTDEQFKIHTLWRGLRPDIQKDLWYMKLSPEVSSWRQV